jgi:transposase
MYGMRDDSIDRRAVGTDGRPGRKSIATRKVLEAVLWILNTGAQWHMLPQFDPNYKTVHVVSNNGVARKCWQCADRSGEQIA